MSVRAAPATPEIEVGLAATEPRPRTPAPFGRRVCRVERNERLGAYALLRIADADGPTPQPGQFYMLAGAAAWGDEREQRPYLGRAFSVCRVRERSLDFLLEEIGPGTRRLAQLRPGEQALVVGPLGAGFTAPDGQAALLVGGGAGLAPLVVWGEALAAAGVRVSSLLGFRSARYAEVAPLAAGEVSVTTDDGSVGHHGLVTDLLETTLEQSGEAAVYACGPPAMLESVRQICASRDVRAELALEQAMACGFGACFGCAVRTRRGYLRVCVDGPVLDAAELDQRSLDG